MTTPKIERRIPVGDFRRLVVDEIKRLLLETRLKREIAEGDGFVKRDPTVLIRHTSTREIVDEIAMRGAQVTHDFPDLAPIATASTELARRALSATVAAELLQLYSKLMEMHHVTGDGAQPDNFSLTPEDDAVLVCAEDIGDDVDGSPSEAIQQDVADQSFLAATANLLAQARRKARPLTRDELIAVATAYRLLDRGVQLPTAYKSIGVYGFRRHQTNLSLANPGEGHVAVTCAHADLLEGAIVHIEHIDRDGISDRESVEPYRLPATINASRVRLHTGAKAPCTAYVGRPVFENGVAAREGESVIHATHFDRDLLKTAHAAASACTAFFMNGVADCKIAIERMGYRQAVAFMRAVAGNVVRDPTRQYVSAAFNINIPLWDDHAAPGRLLTDRREIAELAIDLTREGRFDKVTWDGASNEVPSRPIIDQLPLEVWIALVHTAHELGLETYVSAGLQPHHMRECVFTGVDGVGIGTSLHFRHPETNAIGQLKPEAVREVLQVRDIAALDPLGRGARLLATWDRMHFEGTLPQRLNPVRLELFARMSALDSASVAHIVAENECPPPDDPFVHPLIAEANRILDAASEDPVGLQRLGAEAWGKRVAKTGELLASNDISGLKELLR